MRIVIQRVTEASVTINGQLHSTIGPGMMVLVGVREGDTLDDMRRLAQKTVNLRIFDDEQGVMNRSIIDAGGQVLAVSQFTLNASTKKGNRPATSTLRAMTWRCRSMRPTATRWPGCWANPH